MYNNRRGESMKEVSRTQNDPMTGHAGKAAE